MDEQLFRLSGENWDLEELVFSFQAGPATVKKIEEIFYLCLELESGRSEEEIRVGGETALNRMNAICLVRDERFRSPRITGITRRDPITGKIITTVNLQGRVEARARCRATLTVGESDGTIRPRQPTFGERALEICSTNEALRETLRTYGTVEHDWKGLYTVLEAIEKANNGKIPTTWATKGEVTDFNKTANSPAALGPESRHGFGYPGIKEPAMTISQARALVQKVLHAWIAELIAKASK
jgi:hypothetical protein